LFKSLHTKYLHGEGEISALQTCQTWRRRCRMCQG